MSPPIQFPLGADEIPTHWCNLLPHFRDPLPPPLHPGTGEPVTPDLMEGLFPASLVAQEMSGDATIEIPQEVRDVYALYRPTPLLRAVRLEKALGTPAHIYYKYEGASPVGSHKPNTAIPQAYYNKVAGTKRLASETGAGQWGSALAFACSLFGLECTIYMVKISFQQKPYRKLLMQTYGADVHGSPSPRTAFGRQVLADTPDSHGSLGIAISEAIEDQATHPGTKYALGSVLNHVCLHQTVIGLETIRQMEMAGETPDIIIGCAGGGSNFAGIAFPFIKEMLGGQQSYRIIAAEPASCPSLTQGDLRYDFGDTARTTPMMMMHTLGHDFMPPSIHAGGLRYHGMAPMVSHCLHLGLIEAAAVPQLQVFQAAVQFARSEGIVPAPESAHGIAVAIDEAIRCREEKQKKVIVFNLSGNGLLDLAAYDSYLTGKMQESGDDI